MLSLIELNISTHKNHYKKISESHCHYDKKKYIQRDVLSEQAPNGMYLAGLDCRRKIEFAC